VQNEIAEGVRDLNRAQLLLWQNEQSGNREAAAHDRDYIRVESVKLTQLHAQLAALKDVASWNSQQSTTLRDVLANLAATKNEIASGGQRTQDTINRLRAALGEGPYTGPGAIPVLGPAPAPTAPVSLPTSAGAIFPGAPGPTVPTTVEALNYLRQSRDSLAVLNSAQITQNAINLTGNTVMNNLSSSLEAHETADTASRVATVNALNSLVSATKGTNAPFQFSAQEALGAAASTGTSVPGYGPGALAPTASSTVTPTTQHVSVTAPVNVTINGANTANPSVTAQAVQSAVSNALEQHTATLLQVLGSGPRPS
jgi:hypothetical protein